jgi:hypothetical protein
MIDEQDVREMILQAEKQRDALVAATKEQVAKYEKLANAAESTEEKKHYFELALKTVQETEAVLTDTNKKIASVREQLERFTHIKH